MAEFKPRLTSSGMWQSKYWYSDNPFEASGYGLPNCTAYAYGRIYELTGSKPTYLSLGNAGDWFGHNQTEGKCEYGYVPRLGAIACWSEPGKGGHVAVVERINADGSFVVSQSGYKRPLTSYPPDMWHYFWLDTCDGATKMGALMRSTYVFQGFIYCPNISTPTYPTGWISKNAYLTRSEMQHNAKLVWQFFGSRGWSLNAVCAMLGNMETESTINPGIWESLSAYSGGYGLVQWTPYTKYANWAGGGWQNNGNKECERIVWEKDNGEQWFSNPAVTPSNPPISFKEFSTSTLPVATLANYFLWYYEHPGDPNQPKRAEQARAWYDFLKDTSPGAPLPPPKPKKTHRTMYNSKWAVALYLGRR